MTRGERLAELVAEKELDQLFVSDLTNVRYLTGFTGTNGACLVGGDELVFFTDFRYTERAKDEVAPEWERPEAERELIPQIVARMSGRVGFEDAKLSVRQLARLEAAAGEDVEFVPAGDLVEQLRVVKEPEELERIAAAAELTDGVYEWAIERGLAGRTERDVARACEARLRELGAEPSFPPIVAARPRTARSRTPSRASARSARASWSSSTWGRCSTATARTAPAPSPPATRGTRPARSTSSCSARRPPRSRPCARRRAGKEVDAVAREIISEAGHGDHFGHGLGHGVGLEVHEGPRLATTSEDELRGERRHRRARRLPARAFGVRIEDLVVVTGTATAT